MMLPDERGVGTNMARAMMIIRIVITIIWVDRSNHMN